jgi:hypothetical protein
MDGYLEILGILSPHIGGTLSKRPTRNLPTRNSKSMKNNALPLQPIIYSAKQLAKMQEVASFLFGTAQPFPYEVFGLVKHGSHYMYQIERG